MVPLVKEKMPYSLYIYIECGLLHNTYSISAELFINFDTKLFSFSVLDVSLTILEPLGPTSPLDHRSGVPER